uniref:Uncharacterized protein n=1 Tax=Rhizophora mucronata TaxID=61149 RepID=A0A2P2P1B0_RHIMU
MRLPRCNRIYRFHPETVLSFHTMGKRPTYLAGGWLSSSPVGHSKLHKGMFCKLYRV